MKMLRAANGKPVEGKMEATAEKRGQGSGREEGGKGAATDRRLLPRLTLDYLPCQSGPRDRPPLDRRVLPGLQISGSLEAHAHSLALRSIQVCPSLRHTGCVCASCDCVRRCGGRTDDSSVDPKAAAEAAAGEAGLHPAGTAGNRF